MARSSEPQRRKDYLGHFRQRSVSDANLATLHLSEWQWTIIDYFFQPPSTRKAAVMKFFWSGGFVSAGELNMVSRGQKRFSTDDILLKLNADFQNQVRTKKM